MEASKLLQLDIRPDEVVGDFDSLSKEAKLFYEGVKFTHSKDQDCNDLEKALKSIDSPVVIVLGAFGGRIDHTLSAIQILHKFSKIKQEQLIVLMDEHSKMVYLHPHIKHSIRLSALDNDAGIGLIPIPGNECKLETTGLKWNIGEDYPLQKLSWDTVVSTSNQLADDNESRTVSILTDKPILFSTTFI